MSFAAEDRWPALVAAEAHVLALQPGLVRQPRPHRDDAAGAESHGAWQSADGYTDSPDRGSALVELYPTTSVGGPRMV